MLKILLTNTYVVLFYISNHYLITLNSIKKIFKFYTGIKKQISHYKSLRSLNQLKKPISCNPKNKAYKNGKTFGECKDNARKNTEALSKEIQTNKVHENIYQKQQIMMK